jgi:hypothetical protein
MITLLLALTVAVQATDSARAAHWGRVLNQTSDSLDRIRGATAGFRVDLANASPDLILVRAAQVRATCVDAVAPLQTVEALLTSEVYSTKARREQSRLISGTTELRRALDRCQREWLVPTRPVQRDADSLRAWGPYRSAQLEASLRRYLGLVRLFMKHADLKKPAVS